MILNRYHNIIALDNTLVKLNQDKYINANMISGKYSPQKFIMTQAPEKNTIADFYQMIHDYDVTTVVCLTQLIESGIEKATKYWPDSGSIVYDKWIIELHNQRQLSNIVCRELDIIDMKTDKCIHLKMFHCVSWIDHDAPSMNDFNKLIELVSNNSNVDTPVIVHCSAGIGRSGTFVSAYNYTLLTKLDQKPDIKAMVCWLKRRRTGSVQTTSQYKFLLDFCTKN
jgi:protein tyrosine phosphatase